MMEKSRFVDIKEIVGKVFTNSLINGYYPKDGFVNEINASSNTLKEYNFLDSYLEHNKN